MKSEIIKSTQEQAVAAWTEELNFLRITDELEKIANQEQNLQEVLKMLEEVRIDIAQNIVEKDRGHTSGMHGFIAERLQVWLENAQNVLLGEKESYELIDDNSVDDLLRDGETPIQMKFVISDGKLGLTKVLEHLKKYPDFLKRGGKYILPKDFYERILKYYEMSEEEMNRLPRGERSFCQYIKEFFSSGEISINDIEPATVNYSEVQVKKYEETIDKREEELKKQNDEIEEKIHMDHKPSMEECIKIALVSAAMEGGVQLLLEVYKKLKEGKKIQDFKKEDWGDVGISTSTGAAKGGIRGAAVYLFTNTANVNASIASAYVTATFGIILLERKRREAELSDEEFQILSQIACLDVTVSAISAMLGGMLIPIPILGPLVGNVTGMFILGIIKENNISSEKCKHVYIDNELLNLDEKLREVYQGYMSQLQEELLKFETLMDFAFSQDVHVAFTKSIELAELLGVESKYVLKNENEIDKFFYS